MIETDAGSRWSARPMAVAALLLVSAACGGGSDDAANDDTAEPDEAESLPSPGTDGSVVATTAPADTTPATDDDDGGGAQVVEDAPVLAGTEWTVHTLYSAEYGMTNVWPDTEVSLSFGPDGALSGFSGCNDFTGTYEVIGDYLARDRLADIPEGQQIAISGLPEPVGGCGENADEQEADVYVALETADLWRLEEDLGLSLTGDQGLHIGADPAG